ncbi:hypothetical protein L3Q82_012652, partial [Scortum barcoo]
MSETAAQTAHTVISRVYVHPVVSRYAGYCPQLKYSMGKSYGQLTAELLSSPEVKHSSRLVLHMGHFPAAEPDSGLTLRSISDSFIPKSQNYFASSYSETCRKALSEFYQEGRMRIQQKSSDLPAVVQSSNQRSERPKLPLTPISSNVIYKPLKSFTPTGKPYSMADDDPYKFFISGFTGHVPKSRFLIGKGYPITTNQALIQFGKQQRSDPTSQDIPGRKSSTVTPMPTIYPSNRGVVPSFTGHIPGLISVHVWAYLRSTFQECTGKERHQEGPSGKVIKSTVHFNETIITGR